MRRLIDYAGLFERDLQFATRAILDDMEKTPQDVFKEWGLERYNNGEILAALTSIRGQTAEERTTKAEFLAAIREHFGDIERKSSPVRGIRNKIAHLNMFAPGEPLDLTSLVNDARQMMAYDRKLKNAVSQSVRELLVREGFELTWIMKSSQAPHELTDALIRSRTATHLGGTRLIEKERNHKGWQKKHSINEALHSRGLTEAVAKMFAR